MNTRCSRREFAILPAEVARTGMGTRHVTTYSELKCHSRDYLRNGDVTSTTRKMINTHLAKVAAAFKLLPLLIPAQHNFAVCPV